VFLTCSLLLSRLLLAGNWPNLVFALVLVRRLGLLGCFLGRFLFSGLHLLNRGRRGGFGLGRFLNGFVLGGRRSFFSSGSLLRLGFLLGSPSGRSVNIDLGLLRLGRFNRLSLGFLGRLSLSLRRGLGLNLFNRRLGRGLLSCLLLLHRFRLGLLSRLSLGFFDRFGLGLFNRLRLLSRLGFSLFDRLGGSLNRSFGSGLLSRLSLGLLDRLGFFRRLCLGLFNRLSNSFGSRGFSSSLLRGRCRLSLWRFDGFRLGFFSRVRLGLLCRSRLFRWSRLGLFGRLGSGLSRSFSSRLLSWCCLSLFGRLGLSFLGRFSLWLFTRFNLDFLGLGPRLLDSCSLGGLLNCGVSFGFSRLRLSLDLLDCFWLGLFFNRLRLGLPGSFGRSFNSRLLSRCCLRLFSGFGLGIFSGLSLDLRSLGFSFLSRFSLRFSGLSFSLSRSLDLGLFDRLVLHFSFGFLDRFRLDLSAGFFSWLSLNLLHNLSLGFLSGLRCRLCAGRLGFGLGLFGRLCLDLGGFSLGFLSRFSLDLLSWFNLGLIDRLSLGLLSRVNLSFSSRLSLGILCSLGRFLRRFRLDFFGRLGVGFLDDRFSFSLLIQFSLGLFDRLRRSFLSSGLHLFGSWRGFLDGGRGNLLLRSCCGFGSLSRLLCLSLLSFSDWLFR
jgi:hypothetical protein